MKTIKQNLTELILKGEKAFRVSQGIKAAAQSQQKMAEASKLKPQAPGTGKGK